MSMIKTVKQIGKVSSREPNLEFFFKFEFVNFDI